jgi:hypothetical protein
MRHQQGVGENWQVRAVLFDRSGRQDHGRPGIVCLAGCFAGQFLNQDGHRVRLPRAWGSVRRGTDPCMTLVRSPDAIAKIATPNHRLPLL